MATNQKVGGSNPFWRTTFSCGKQAISSEIACFFNFLEIYKNGTDEGANIFVSSLLARVFFDRLKEVLLGAGQRRTGGGWLFHPAGKGLCLLIYLKMGKKGSGNLSSGAV